jgi:hypothetical protein
MELGNVFCNNKKETNVWKLRMLKAAFEKKGLVIPDNWDKLTEDEKESRLENLTKFLGEIQ